MLVRVKPLLNDAVLGGLVRVKPLLHDNVLGGPALLLPVPDGLGAGGLLHHHHTLYSGSKLLY